LWSLKNLTGFEVEKKKNNLTTGAQASLPARLRSNRKSFDAFQD
jgi:hypothetical protein